MGGPGNDGVEGGGGTDTLFGASGQDFVHGDYGPDLMFGAEGKDFVNGSRGPDQMVSGEGGDFLIDGPFGEIAKDEIFSGAAGDFILAENLPAAKDVISCGGGFDRVLVDRTDVVAADCERVRVVHGTEAEASEQEQALFESLPQAQRVFWGTFCEGWHQTRLAA